MLGSDGLDILEEALNPDGLAGLVLGDPAVGVSMPAAGGVGPEQPGLVGDPGVRGGARLEVLVDVDEAVDQPDPGRTTTLS